MKQHDTFLELAAVAIDVPLTPAERGRLEQHLAGCPDCVRSAAALHADARAIANLPAVHLPERRGAEILAAALHPSTVRHPLRLVVVLALLGLLLIGSLVVGAQLLRPTDDDLLVVLPVASLSPAPDASPAPVSSPGPDASTAPSPSPVVPADALAWEELATVDDAGIRGLVAFDAGYVAYGFSDELGSVAWFSGDGRTWEATPLSSPHLNCPGWGPAGDDVVADAEVTSGTSNGREVLLAGSELLFTDAACNDPGSSVQTVTWTSSDGRTWDRSDGFRSGTTNARAAGAWPVGNGWQVLDAFSGALWASPDGLAWEPSAVKPQGSTAAKTPLAVGPDGKVVVAQHGQLNGPYFGLIAWDGGAWREVVPPESCAGEPSKVVPPAADGSGSWLLVAGLSVCASADLASWQASTLVAPYQAIVDDLVHTRFGPLAATFCAERTCPAPPPRWQYLGTDGQAWVELGSSVDVSRLADGPAGVIAIGTEGAVWRLIDTRP